MSVSTVDLPALSYVATWRLKAFGIISEYFHLSVLAELNREKERTAVLSIQKVWRGYVTRRYFSHLRFQIIRIQQTFRGFLGRRKFRARVLQMNFKRRMQFYFKHAQVIQKTYNLFFNL